MIDFSNCQIDTTANYGGSDQKRGIWYNGGRYMLKLSDQIDEGKRNAFNSSYSNSVYSEHVCCKILKEFGFDVQETLLGFLHTTSRKGFPKTTPVVACKNFIPDGFELVEFKAIEGALLDTKPPKIPKLSDIYYIYRESTPNDYFSIEMGEECIRRYWDLFVMDAFLGNFDRHANNWGFLSNKETGKISFAPIYDCGSCLYPQLKDDVLQHIMETEEEINMRIFKFPTAALELDTGNKANYFECINDHENRDLDEAILRVVPKIALDKTSRVVDDVDDISDVRKRFYKHMLWQRYEKILLPAYKSLKGVNLSYVERLSIFS